METDFYSASASNVNRTVIQGMSSRQPAGGASQGGNPVAGVYSGVETGNPASHRETEITLQERPLAGVLISASADGMGEIFPLYIGRNMIGSNPEADIYLSEATVAPNHAMILVRMIKDPATGSEMMQVSLTDYDSEYGTAIGEYRVGFDKVMLTGGEILRIGYGYVFAVYLFDSGYPGLGENPGFRPTERVRKRMPEMPAAIAPEPVEPVAEEVFPDKVGAADEFAFYGRTPKAPTSHSRNATVDNMAGFYKQSAENGAAKTVMNPPKR